MGDVSRLRGNHIRKDIILSTVSGVASTKKELIELFDRKIQSVDIITSKSFQVTPNPGNREPIICSPSAGDFGNSVGLRNPGMDAVLPEMKDLREKGMRAILNISLSASNPEDFITLVKAFDPYADMLELNFSCPHAAAGFGASIGSDKATVMSSELTTRCDSETINENFCPANESNTLTKVSHGMDKSISPIISEVCVKIR